MVSDVKSSCFCFVVFLFLGPFVNQVLMKSCYCVLFQSLSLTMEGPSVILDVFSYVLGMFLYISYYVSILVMFLHINFNLFFPLLSC